MLTFQIRLKKSRKTSQPRIRFDLEKLNDPTVRSGFQAPIGGRFAPLATLVDEDADLDSMEILDLCDQKPDLKKKRGEPEGAKDFREIKRKITIEMKTAKETWIQSPWQEVEACLRKNNSQKAYQLVKDSTTEKQGKSTTIQDKSGKCLTEEHEILNRWTVLLRPLQL